MEEELPKRLDDSGRYILRRTNGGRSMPRNRDALCEGDIVLAIAGRSSEGVHIGISDLIDLVRLLEQPLDDTRTLNTVKARQRGFGPTERSCVACGWSFQEDDTPYYLKQHGTEPEADERVVRTDVYVHNKEECIAAIRFAVEQVWESTDVLLSDAI